MKLLPQRPISAIIWLLVPLYLQPTMTDGQTLSNGIPYGHMIIEGDIIVPQFRPFGTFGDTDFWPGGVVPFVFDANVSANNQNLMLAAMAVWENIANVDFTPRNGQSDFARIRDSSWDSEPSNSSQVGRNGGEQIINITDWGSRFIMAHELGHCLGLWHEQSRPDRDYYVEIQWNNIQSGKEHNFDLRSAADVYPKRDYGLSDEETYDFDSVMHYGQWAFSTNTLPTIVVRPPNQSWQALLGQRTHLSRIDTLTMSFLYPEPDWYFVDKTNPNSGGGSFMNPYREFKSGVASVPSASTIWIQPGTHSAAGTYSKPITLRAPLGNVMLGL
jgi:hypothetical protein